MKNTPTLRDVGEHGVIQEIIAAAPSSLNGDDAAVLLPLAPNSRTVATTDMLVEGRHFCRDWSTPYQVGMKAITQNYADIEAMGARPIGALMALGAPLDTPVSVVREIAEGIAQRTGEYNTELVGGDVTQAEKITVSVTAIGALGGDRQPLALSAARAGQKVVAHGKIGWSAAGWALLERFGRDIPDAELQPLVDFHCAPMLDPGRGVIARATGATAMTDNSDGLVHDLHTIARRSSVRINIFADAVAPDELLVRAGELLDHDPWDWVLAGGEDHTLLGTTMKDAPSGFRLIGEVTRGNGGDLVTVDGAPARYISGWESFPEEA
ncbi:thiamine-phosphate kinase [Corynebacterium ammoniagenes]|uniref:Thiamine-monophosphate kinase n=1 Tax=Corynebacterium ammoniagenes DSM 20306 TaxID=649754 RepID=A0ABN0ADF5_CORAM|nr:thiamine-phosphate kinase [Corynebacterium ammoniagenes]EFG80796.1 thiamine-phosphate kinase [Corynebacterium ammoniagenes DSM 20306]